MKRLDRRFLRLENLSIRRNIKLRCARWSRRPRLLWVGHEERDDDCGGRSDGNLLFLDGNTFVLTRGQKHHLDKDGSLCPRVLVLRATIASAVYVLSRLVGTRRC